MAETQTVSLTKFARDTLTSWQKIVDKGLTLDRDGMKTCLNLEIVVLQLIALVEQAEQQAASGSGNFDDPVLVPS